MPDRQPETGTTQQLLNRLAAGDQRARDLLIEHWVERLRRLARKMLRSRPNLRRWDDTDDLLQNALIRLNRALQAVAPESPRRFVGLAATQIRRELIDLHRRHYGPQGDGCHQAVCHEAADSHTSTIRSDDPVDPRPGPAEQVALNEAIEMLPDDLREVFELSFYAGMTQAEIAELLGVSTKTIKRRWRAARLQLQQVLDPDFPTSSLTPPT